MSPRMRAAVTELILAAVEHERSDHGTQAASRPTTHAGENGAGEGTRLHTDESSREASRDDYRLAADEGPSRGKDLAAWYDQLGEESQDEEQG